MSEVLHRHSRKLSAQERNAVLDGAGAPTGTENTVLRHPGDPIGLAALDGLMAEFMRRTSDAASPWRASKPSGDKWLAPRLHFALRLTRSEAGDRGAWQWLACRYPEYVQWRWLGAKGVMDERWFGPVHKQALARLWWTAELFRDGADYSPVERAFINQDLVNSYLHRPLVRCRSLALGILDVFDDSGDADITSDRVNDLARVLNLTLVGAPPEAETDYQQDDLSAYVAWTRKGPPDDLGWDPLPTGPTCRDTTHASLDGGRKIAQRGWALATNAQDRT